MSDVKIGQLAGIDAQRDAVHVAVVPVVAGMPLAIGQCVRMDKTPSGEPIAVACAFEKAIGVVDPFLSLPVQSKERFWLFLKAGTIVGMRHHWKHPAFDDSQESKKEISIAWLNNAADKAGVDYEEMMSFVESDDYIHMGENENYKEIDCEEFATHVEIVTGKKDVSPPFSCSC